MPMPMPGAAAVAACLAVVVWAGPGLACTYPGTPPSPPVRLAVTESTSPGEVKSYMDSIVSWSERMQTWIDETIAFAHCQARSVSADTTAVVDSFSRYERQREEP